MRTAQGSTSRRHVLTRNFSTGLVTNPARATEFRDAEICEQSFRASPHAGWRIGNPTVRPCPAEGAPRPDSAGRDVALRRPPPRVSPGQLSFDADSHAEWTA